MTSTLDPPAPRLDTAGRLLDLRLVRRHPWLTSLVTSAVVLPLMLRWALSDSMAGNSDDGVYWEVAKSTGYGATLYSDVFHSQPPLMAWLQGLPYRLSTVWPSLPIPQEQLSRAVATGAALAIVLLTARLGLRLAGRRVAAWAALAACLVPTLQSYSNQFGADIGMTALVTATVWTLAHPVEGARWRPWAAGVFAALALWVKLNAVVVAPAVIVLLWFSRDDAGRSRRTYVSARAGAAFLATHVALFAYFRPPAQFWDQVIFFHVDAQGHVNPAVTPKLTWLLGPLPALLLTAVGLLLLLAWRRRESRLQQPLGLALGLWLLGIIPFLTLYSPWYTHHLVAFVPPGAVLLAVALRPVVEHSRVPARRAVEVTAALAVSCLALGLLGLRADAADPPPTMLACLRSLDPDRPVTTDDQRLVAEAGLRTPSWLVDTSDVRLGAGRLSDRQIIRSAQAARTQAVLFGPVGRLAARPGLVAWTTEHYPYVFYADGYALYLESSDALQSCGVVPDLVIAGT